MLRVTVRQSANTGRSLRHPLRKNPPTLGRRAPASTEKPLTLSQRVVSTGVHAGTPTRKTAVRPTPEVRLANTWSDWWLSGTEEPEEIRIFEVISPEKQWECIRTSKPALLFKTQLFDLDFESFHAGKLEGFEAYAIVLCHIAATFTEEDASLSAQNALFNSHLVNVLNHLRAATIGMPSMAQPIQLHITQQASLILKLLRQDKTTEAYVYVSHLHNELNAIVNKQPSPATYANVHELGRSKCENLCSVESSDFKLLKKELDRLNENFPELAQHYLRASLKDIVMYLSHLVTGLLSAEKISRNQAGAINCKITALAKSLTPLLKKTSAPDTISDPGLAELAHVYHLHQKWLGAMKRWIQSQ